MTRALSQPQGLLRMNLTNQLAYGLRCAVLPGVNKAWCITGRINSPNGVAKQGTPYGLAGGFGSALGVGTTDKIVTGLTGAFPSTGRSYFFRAKRNGNGGGNLGRLFDKTNGSSGQFLMWYNADARINYGYYLGGGATEVDVPVPNSGTTAAVGTYFDLLVTHQFTNNTHTVSFYVNGALVGTDSTRTGALTDAPTTRLTIGNRDSDNVRGWDGLIECAYVWDRVLTSDEAMSLTANRYQMYEVGAREDDVLAKASNNIMASVTSAGGMLITGVSGLNKLRNNSASVGITVSGSSGTQKSIARTIMAIGGAVFGGNGSVSKASSRLATATVKLSGIGNASTSGNAVMELIGTLNDLIMYKLRQLGLFGARNDMLDENKYWRGITGDGNGVPLNDVKKKVFKQLGYSGELNDMEKEYWKNK